MSFEPGLSRKHTYRLGERGGGGGDLTITRDHGFAFHLRREGRLWGNEQRGVNFETRMEKEADEQKVR